MSRIDEIRARLVDYELCGETPSEREADIRYLLARIEKLEAVREAAKKDHANNLTCKACGYCGPDMEKALAECEE